MRVRPRKGAPKVAHTPPRVVETVRAGVRYGARPPCGVGCSVGSGFDAPAPALAMGALGRRPRSTASARSSTCVWRRCRDLLKPRRQRCFPHHVSRAPSLGRGDARAFLGPTTRRDHVGTSHRRRPRRLTAGVRQSRLHSHATLSSSPAPHPRARRLRWGRAMRSHGDAAQPQRPRRRRMPAGIPPVPCS